MGSKKCDKSSKGSTYSIVTWISESTIGHKKRKCKNKDDDEKSTSSWKTYHSCSETCGNNIVTGIFVLVLLAVFIFLFFSVIRNGVPNITDSAKLEASSMVPEGGITENIIESNFNNDGLLPKSIS